MFDYLKENPEEGFIAGMYDLVPERCRFLIDHYGAADAVVYESLEQALDDSRAEAAFVATWDSAHVQCAIAAMGAGKHVFCEKPMATTVQDCDAIIAAAKKANGIFYLGMNLRHCPVQEKLHEWVAAGRLGKVLTIEANEYYYSGKTYFRRWNRLRKFGGGLWITKASHDFDIINWLAGGKPVRVFATSSLSHYKPKDEAGMYCRDCPIKDTCPDFYDVTKPTNVWESLWTFAESVTGEKRDMCLYNSEKDTFDNGMAVVDYDNDIRASYTLNVVSANTNRQLSVLGTEGAAEGDMEKGVVTFRRRHGNEEEIIDLRKLMESGHGGADDKIMADFFHCCRTGDAPKSSWTDGRLSVQVGLAARESCDTGMPVAIF